MRKWKVGDRFLRNDGQEVVVALHLELTTTTDSEGKPGFEAGGWFYFDDCLMYPVGSPSRLDLGLTPIGDKRKEVQEGTVVSNVAEVVEHPPHYTHGKYECWDVIADWGLDYFLGNAVKYVCRAGRKGEMRTDLEKAKAYIEKRLSLLQEKE